MREATLNKTWSAVSSELISDPDNLSLWQKLVEEAESNNKNGINKSTPPSEIELLRTTYQQFLDKFPLLFKYWIKYATWEFRLGNVTQAQEVYKASLQKLQYNIDIWVSYLQFEIDTSHDQSAILRLFETARHNIGYHFHSYEFYDLYLSFLENYQNDTNDYKLKYHVLLRVVVEIPLYHFEHFFKKLFQIIADIGTSGDREILEMLVPTKDLMNVKNPKLGSVQLKKIFIDVYITTQHKVYELFQFEKKLSKQYFDTNYISRQQLDVWSSYLDFLEAREYPPSYLKFSYERSLLATASYTTIWTKYANYYIKDEKYTSAIEVLNRGYSFTGRHELFIKLVDCTIHIKNIIKARDLVVAYIRNNVSVPIPVYEKLVSIERLIHPKDTEYLVNLIKELITETNQDWWFRHILLYDIPSESKASVFADFKTTFHDSQIYQDSSKKLERYSGKTEPEDEKLDFTKEYDDEINMYL